MALVGTYTLFGVSVPTAYARVAQVLGSKLSGWTGQVAVYSEQPPAFDPSQPPPPPPAQTVTVQAAYVAGEDAVQSIYNAAAALPSFAQMASDEAATTISKRDFLNRFTVSERIAIRSGANGGDAVAEDFLDILAKSETVTLTDQQTKDGVNYCVSKAYLTADRATAILTP